MASHVRRGKDPIVVLLDELRADLCPEKVQAILDYLDNCCCEYFNVRRAVERSFTREVTEQERKLIAKLP